MSLVLRKELAGPAVVGIWKMEEPEEYFLERLSLTEYDRAALDAIKMQPKRHEWLASRYLLKYLVNSPKVLILDKDKSGKPFLQNEDCAISMSHTHEYVAVMVSWAGEVGIDIEPIHPRIERIARRFMKHEEVDALENDPQRIEKLILYWSAKESMFKYYAKGNVEFATELEIKPIAKVEDSGELDVLIKKPGFDSWRKLSYQHYHGHLMTWMD